jgi:hypothetical protein
MQYIGTSSPAWTINASLHKSKSSAYFSNSSQLPNQVADSANASNYNQSDITSSQPIQSVILLNSSNLSRIDADFIYPSVP